MSSDDGEYQSSEGELKSEEEIHIQIHSDEDEEEEDHGELEEGEIMEEGEVHEDELAHSIEVAVLAKAKSGTTDFVIDESGNISHIPFSHRDLLEAPMVPPTESLSSQQIGYLLILCCVGPFIFSFVISYGFGVVFFWSRDVVQLWGFPFSFCADVILTVIAQGYLSWVIMGAIVSRDCRLGVPGIGFLPQTKGDWLNNWLGNTVFVAVDLFHFDGPTSTLWEVPDEWRVLVRKILYASRSAFVYVILCLTILVPPTLLSLSIAQERHHAFFGGHASAQIKAIYSSILMIFQCFPVGYFALSTGVRVPNLNESFRQGIDLDLEKGDEDEFFDDEGYGDGDSTEILDKEERGRNRRKEKAREKARKAREREIERLKLEKEESKRPIGSVVEV